MNNIPDPTLLNWVVQGGSFGLIAAMIAYAGKVLIPRTIAAFNDQTTKFDAMLQRTEDRHALELERRDERDDRIAAAIERIAERLTRLEARSEERDDGYEPRYGRGSTELPPPIPPPSAKHKRGAPPTGE